MVNCCNTAEVFLLVISGFCCEHDDHIGMLWGMCPLQCAYPLHVLNLELGGVYKCFTVSKEILSVRYYAERYTCNES